MRFLPSWPDTGTLNIAIFDDQAHLILEMEDKGFFLSPASCKLAGDLYLDSDFDSKIISKTFPAKNVRKGGTFFV